MLPIYAVSDATGSTAEGVIRAALTQFDAANVTVSRHGGVRDVESIRKIIAEAAQTGGFIVHTFVSEPLRRFMLTEGRAHNVITIDLMGPLLARLSELMATPPRAQPGLFSPFDPDYMQRIEAIDYTVRHDDGRSIFDLDRAEIVLVGVSRTAKTPLSIYLSYRGWKVANIPLILDVEPPRNSSSEALLFTLPRRRVVGLIVRPERLVEFGTTVPLRKARIERMGTRAFGYADPEHVRKELAFAYEVFGRRPDWPLVDVTSKPIEETAAEVVALLAHTLPGEEGQSGG
jgi:regulator of PEP synthase PpsR (kinase-PPPase family)